MRCPRCGFEGELIEGGCARCGYGRMSTSGSRPLASSSPLGRQIVVSSPRSLVAHSLAPGEVLRQGRYRIVQQLTLPPNQQNQGTAWLAMDARSPQNLVVLREFIPERRASPEVEQELRSVAQRLAELGRNPGIPRLLDVFIEGGAYYFIFQHVEGKSLARLVQQGGPLPERTVAEYGRQLSEVLSALSSQQPPLVHGSIRPDTVIISPDGKRASLIHFPLRTSKTFSEKGTIPGYLAPEQVHANYGDVGPASDLYGLAATLHYALTGYDQEVHMAFFYPPAHRLNSAVSSRMEAILSRALRVKASQRYTQPIEMRSDLEAIPASSSTTGRLPDSANGSGHLTDTRQALQRRQSDSSALGMFAIVTTLISVLLLGGIFLAIVRGSGPETSLNGAALTGTATAGAMLTATAVSRSQQEATAQEQLLELQSFTKQGIGVSDGRFVFDTYAGRTDVDLKKQAAQAIQSNDLDTAASRLTQAVNTDPSDGEAKIYSEDVHILQNSLPHITIVLGLGFDSSPGTLAVERANMQAAFLAQYEINEFQSLPHHLHLYLLIASTAAGTANVPAVAQFIFDRVVKLGNPDHIVGVVGWPSSSQTVKARDILAAAHIPLISQTASDTKLSGSSPYFFRVNPSYDMQGNALGTIAANQFQAKTVLVMRDPDDVYGSSLADAFITRLQALNIKVINDPKYYFSRGKTTVGAYQTVVNAAISNSVDLIFQPGADVDAVRLAHAVGNAFRTSPANQVLVRLKILGGGALDTSLLLGQGDSLDALLASHYPQDMQRLNFIALADSNEWTYLKVSQSRQPTFFTDWMGTFQNSVQEAENAGPPDQNAIMTYDAVNVMSKAAALARGSLTGQAVRDALASFGHGKVPAYQGVSGRIFFDNTGNPVDKALVLLDVESDGNNGNVIRVKQVVGTFLASS